MLKNKKLLAALAGVTILVAAVIVWWPRNSAPAVTIDLISLLPDAQKRTTWVEPGDAPFSVKDVTLAGETHRAIYAPPHSRIRFKVQVPRRGTLDVYLGMREDSWTADGNGSQFRIGLSDWRNYEEYLREVLNPRGRDRDRRWMPVSIDLSAYEGEVVEINLNTDPGPPSDPGDARNDFALWGEPRIVGR